MPRDSPYGLEFSSWSRGSGSESQSSRDAAGVGTPAVQEQDVFFRTSDVESVFAMASKSRAFRQSMSWAPEPEADDDDDNEDEDDVGEGGVSTKNAARRSKSKKKASAVEGQRTRDDGAAEAAKAALPETGPFTSQPTPAQLSQIAQVAPPTMFGHGAGFRQGGGSAEQPAPVTLAPPPPPEPSPAELLLLRRAVAVRIFRERRSVAARRAVERSQSLRRFWVRNDVEIGGDGTAAGGGDSDQVSSAQPLSRWAVDQFRLTFSLAGGGSMLARQRLSSLAMLCSTLEGAAARECQTVLGWASRPESRRLPRLTDASLSRSSFDGVALRSLQSALLELTSLPGAGTGSSKGEPECGGLEVFAELKQERREEKRRGSKLTTN